MDSTRFDALARSLATPASRRSLLGAALGGLIASRVRQTAAQTPEAMATPPAATPMAQPPAPVTVCTNPDLTGLQKRVPGELVAYEEITAAGGPAVPPGARAWRVLYVSTGRDDTERTLVCGVVIAPASGAAVVAGSDGQRRGRVVSWAHGTIGLITRCQLSINPAARIFGPTPIGINLVAWTSSAAGDGPRSTPEDGILAGMLGAGWIVTATDYYADLWGGTTLQPYIIGKIEAANGVDIIRAAHHLMTEVGSPTGADAYDVVTWGHSQGGHAAMWMGQMLEPYANATASVDSPSLSLSGVVAEAPASVLVAQPGDPDTALGAGLFDWLAARAPEGERNPEVALLYSYAFAAWASYAAGGAPDAAAMPALPPSSHGLNLATVTTPEATKVVRPIADLCPFDTDLVGPLITPFAELSFVPPELADGPTIDGLIHGNFDNICAGDPTPELAAWCDWCRFNSPGPRGTSPLPTLPRRGESLAPVLIATGSGDTTVHCVAPATAPDAVPSGRDCVAAALYAALAAEYCPGGEARGHVALSVWHSEPGVVEATHDSIPGIVASADLATPRYEGSPLQRFITAAFEGTLQPGCTASVVNGEAID